jgi:hypothetical protein
MTVGVAATAAPLTPISNGRTTMVLDQLGWLSLCAAALVTFAGLRPAGADEPIKLHPDNPHYFLFRGKPTILLTSGEHYGAVLNLDFDYVKYLDSLASKGFNYTRAFSGAYREIPGSFGIERNTLAPLPGRYACPWARGDQPGYSGGGNKFDLGKWDDAYFARLRDFVAQAGKRGVVVELSLFCPFYEQKGKNNVDALWEASPMHAMNNVNGVGTCKREEAYTLKNGNLMPVQEAMVRKIVTELKGFDNLFYEICNEPYFGGVSEEWQAHVAEVITKAEEAFPARHLIAQNIANHGKKIEKPNPAVSIFNFHYAFPPRTVYENYGLNKVIGDDETGFRGSGADPYRTEAWDFLLAGGGLYNNLDYSFNAAHPDGSDTKAKAPGAVCPELRDQLAVLREFMSALDFIRSKPDNSAVKGSLPEGVTARALVQPGKVYAVYVNAYRDPNKKPITPTSTNPGDSSSSRPGTFSDQGDLLELTLELPAGAWKAEWINTKTGKTDKTETFDHTGGERKLASPKFSVDVALRVTVK